LALARTGTRCAGTSIRTGNVARIRRQPGQQGRRAGSNVVVRVGDPTDGD
jgi:hypothetical protein